MLSREEPDRIHLAFDDHRLVANAGLVLPVTLAHHLGLVELVDNHVDQGNAPGGANAGDKFLTLAASALAGGDCIDDAHALRAGGTDRVLGSVIKVPDWLSNNGQGLQHQDAVELGRLLLASLLDGHFERVSASFDEEDYLVQPDLLGNAIFKTDLAQRDGLKPAGNFELNRDYLTQFSLFLGVCGGFRIR